MDRVVTYTRSLPRALDIQKAGQNAMVGLARLSESVLGSTTVADGFVVAPTSPAGLSVTVGPGTVYQSRQLEESAISSLSVDTHTIVKQGIALDATTLTLSPPATVGFAVNVLIQVAYTDADGDNTVLNYYNAADPTTPLVGPGGNGQAQPTTRKGIASVGTVYGAPATAGTQLTPAPTAGFVGIAVVTLTYGQGAIGAGSIAPYITGRTIPARLPDIPAAVQNQTYAFAYATGTGIALAATISPAPTSISPGMRVTIVVPADMDSGATFNLNNSGPKPILRPGSLNIGRTDHLAGSLLTLEMMPSGVWQTSTAIANATISETLVRTAHGTGANFGNLSEAFDWLGRRRISSTGLVILQLPAGKLYYPNDLVFSHPDGDRIQIVGQSVIQSLPVSGTFQISGTSPSQRAADTAVNLAILRGYYNTEIVLVGGAQIRGAGPLGLMRDILITSEGVGTADNLVWSAGAIKLSRIATAGSAGRGIAALGAYISLSGVCYSLGCAGSGLTAEPGGSVALTSDATLVTLSNGAHGAFANAGAIHSPSSGPSPGSGWVYAFGNVASGVAAGNNGGATLGSSSIANLNGDCGFRADSGGSVVAVGTTASSNGASGYAANVGSKVSAMNSTGSSNGASGYSATNGSVIVRTGGTTGGPVAASPAVGSVGNGNATIV